MSAQSMAIVAQRLGCDPETFTAEDFEDLITYDPDTGFLHWGERGAPHRWGSCAAKARKQADCYGDTKYSKVSIYGQSFFAHRLIWWITYGYWPDHDIDHIDGSRDNNRLENLREATRSQNVMNSPRRSSNTSGANGVSWRKKNRKWYAYIRFNHVMENLGYYDKFDDAVAARRARELELYGEFSRLR